MTANIATRRSNVEARQRRAEVLHKHLDGMPFVEIARQMGISKQRVSKMWQDALKDIEAPAVEEMRRRENLRYDRMEMVLLEILRRRHVVISQGKIVGRYAGVARDPDTNEVIRTEDGKPVLVWDEVGDDDPAIRTCAQLIKLWERRAKLNGLDMPVRIKIEDESKLDEEIEGLLSDINQAQIGPGQEHPG